MDFKHKTLAGGGWEKLSLAEQLGNIGSEVWRVLRSQGKSSTFPQGLIPYGKVLDKDEKSFRNAVERALELFDLTLLDNRWQGRRLEIARAREVFCDAVCGGELYGSHLGDLVRYFDHFAFAAQIKKPR